MQTVAGHPDDRVVDSDPLRPEERRLLDEADDEAGEVVVGWRVDARHLSGLAADQRTPILTTAGGYAADDRFGDCGVETTKRDVVEKEQRRGALHQNVVDTVIDQVMADRVVASRIDGDLDLGPDSVGAGD